MIPEPQLGDRVRSLSALCRKLKFPAEGGGCPTASPHPVSPLRQLLFLNCNSYVCTSKIPRVREQLEQREWSLQHMTVLLSTSHHRPLRGFPGIVGQNLQAAGRNAPIFCVCQGGKACLHRGSLGSSWQRGDLQSNSCGSSNSSLLNQKCKFFHQKLIRSQEKATVVCPWVGDRRWAGKQSPPLVSLGCSREQPGQSRRQEWIKGFFMPTAFFFLREEKLLLSQTYNLLNKKTAWAEGNGWGEGKQRAVPRAGAGVACSPLAERPGMRLHGRCWSWSWSRASICSPHQHPEPGPALQRHCLNKPNIQLHILRMKSFVLTGGMEQVGANLAEIRSEAGPHCSSSKPQRSLSIDNKQKIICLLAVLSDLSLIFDYPSPGFDSFKPKSWFCSPRGCQVTVPALKGCWGTEVSISPCINHRKKEKSKGWLPPSKSPH